MNLQASLSKLNKHERRDLLGCSLYRWKTSTCLLETQYGGKALVSSEHWYPIPDTLPQSHMMVVYGKYLGFLKIRDVLLQRKESRFIPSVNSEQSAHASDRKSPFCFFSVANRHAELVWVEKDGLGLQPFMCWVQDLYQSQPVPPAWTQGCPQVSVRTSSGNRGSVQISLKQVSLRNLWYRWQWWVRRNKDLQLEKLFFLCKPSKYGMKITAVQQTSICAVQLLSWRLLSEQSCAFSGDRQFFRARMAAASKCMYHCGWINKYPLKKPGSEE